jgi:nucleoside-diphosphate-sugar epimerase
MKKVLVTGANGFIGSHLVEALLKNGYPVRVLVRRTSNLRWLAGLKLELRYGEVTDYDTLVPAVKDIDCIFHLASTTRVIEKMACDRVNCGGTKNLLEAATRSSPPVRRFVFFSSQAAAGPGRDSQPVDEQMEPKPVSFYGRSKLQGERLTLAFRERLRVVIVRPPAIYGSRDADTVELLRWVQQGIRPLFGGKDGLVSVCYVDDLVRAALAVIDQPVASGSTYFVSDGKIYDYNRVYKTAGELLGVRTIPFPVSAGMLTLYNRFNRDSPLTRDKARELLHGNWICTTAKAQRELGYEPKIFLAEGLARTISWYRKAGWL